MKRAKRETNLKIYKKGYNQGVKGHGSRLCPYLTDEDKKGQWMGGWRKGHADFVAGFRHDPFENLATKNV